ncbi:MAG: hypothetical protein QOJ45_2572 [Verrucomicrobiota bacterium]|jgi:hypothetical protein
MNLNKQILHIVIASAVLTACQTTTPPPPGFGIRVTHERIATQTTMVIAGKGFTPGGHVTINIFSFPRRGDIGPLAVTARPDGTFERREAFAFADAPRDEQFANIRITVRDDASGNAVSDNFSAEPYLRRRN